MNVFSGKIETADNTLDLGTEPIPAKYYYDPEWHELERKAVWMRSWLNVGHVCDLPETGSFVRREFEFAKASLLIVRGKDGNIRAMHNSCTHRGTQLTDEAAGKKTTFSCPYHMWTYGSEGELISAPDFERFYTTKQECALRQVSVDVCAGLIFICFEPQQSLQEFLGDFATLFSGYPYSEATTAFRYSTVLECNWKVALYAFSEGYHVPTIHAGSLPGFRGIEHSDFKLIGPHASSTIYGLGMEAAESTAKFAGLLHSSDAHRPRPDQLPPGINPSGRPDFQFELPNIFPNLLIHLAAGCGYPGMAFFTHQFWPLDHGRTLWEGINYFHPARNAGELAAQIHVNALHRNAWLEDTATMEDTFAGIRSGAIDEMQLMDQEFLIRHAARTLERYLAN